MVLVQISEARYVTKDRLIIAVPQKLFESFKHFNCEAWVIFPFVLKFR